MKKIPLMIKSEVDLNSLCSANSLKEPFKRTVSRLYEMTSQNFKLIYDTRVLQSKN